LVDIYRVIRLVKTKNVIHEITSVRDLSVVRESISLLTL
jgi:hypothetical protein